MAKISARGATKICSVEFTSTLEDDTPVRARLTVCSDGRVLRQIRYSQEAGGGLSGHTRFGKLKDVTDARDKIVRYMTRRGWTEVQ